MVQISIGINRKVRKLEFLAIKIDVRNPIDFYVWLESTFFVDCKKQPCFLLIEKSESVVRESYMNLHF